MIPLSEKNTTRQKVCLLVPVRRGGEINLELSLRHLRDLGVSDWAQIVVVSASDDSTDSFPNFHSAHLRVQNTKPTWGELFSRGIRHAKENDMEVTLWLEPGTLPRVNVMKRLVEISRCRKALTGPGRVVFPCQSSRSGGFKKTIVGLKTGTVNRGEMKLCDTISNHCGCIPVSALPDPDQLAESDFCSATDLGLILTKNGTPCLIDGESTVDYIRGQKIEKESWLLTERSVLEIWKRIAESDCELNPGQRVRFFTRHWGALGIFGAIQPFAKLAAISVVRALVPVRLLRRFYGRRSIAWQLQQLTAARR